MHTEDIGVLPLIATLFSIHVVATAIFPKRAEMTVSMAIAKMIERLYPLSCEGGENDENCSTELNHGC